MHRPEIDAALVSGAKLVPLAQQFGLSKSAMHRHKLQCLPGAVAEALEGASVPMVEAEPLGDVAPLPAAADGGTVDADTPASLADMAALVRIMIASIERLDAAAARGSQAGQASALAAVSAQLHKGVEVLARLISVTPTAPAALSPAVVIMHVSPRPVVEQTAAGALQPSKPAEGALSPSQQAELDKLYSILPTRYVPDAFE